jgi:hypothetical protein
MVQYACCVAHMMCLGFYHQQQLCNGTTVSNYHGRSPCATVGTCWSQCDGSCSAPEPTCATPLLTPVSTVQLPICPNMCCTSSWDQRSPAHTQHTPQACQQTQKQARKCKQPTSGCVVGLSTSAVSILVYSLLLNAAGPPSCRTHSSRAATADTCVFMEPCSWIQVHGCVHGCRVHELSVRGCMVMGSSAD